MDLRHLLKILIVKPKAQIMKKLFIVLNILLFITGCTEDKPIFGDLKVSGYLSNGTGPVANAVVDLNDLVQFRVSSDNEGFFEINNVPSGAHKLNYQVNLESGSFSKVTEDIQLTSDLFLDNLMLPDPVSLNDATIQRNVVSNEVSLSWNKYEGNDFREYKLYKHSTSGLDETTGELLHVATTINDTLFTTTLPHSSETYFRVFIRDNFGLLGGSNIVEVPIGVYESNPEIALGVETSYFLSADEEQELYFDTPSAGLYSIAWFDNWFDDYDAGSIVVSAYNGDKSISYFQNERLIQMNGSPLPILVPSSERVYLDIDHYDDRFPGTYGIKVTLLDESDFSPLEIDTQTTETIGLGGTKLFYFEALAGKAYGITSGNTVNTGAYGDGAATFISIYEENAEAFHTYKEGIPFPMGTPKTIEMSFDTSTKVFLIIDSAYWFDENSVNIMVTEL
jgi:hypothetical protein